MISSGVVWIVAGIKKTNTGAIHDNFQIWQGVVCGKRGRENREQQLSRGWGEGMKWHVDCQSKHILKVWPIIKCQFYRNNQILRLGPVIQPTKPRATGLFRSPCCYGNGNRLHPHLVAISAPGGRKKSGGKEIYEWRKKKTNIFCNAKQKEAWIKFHLKGPRVYYNYNYLLLLLYLPTNTNNWIKSLHESSPGMFSLLHDCCAIRVFSVKLQTMDCGGDSKVWVFYRRSLKSHKLNQDLMVGT